MFLRLLVLVLCIATVYSDILVGGYEKNGNKSLRCHIVKLARQELKSSKDLESPHIKVVSFESQIVAGTNYRLVFTVNGEYQCILVAHKPLPYKQQNISVASFTCDGIQINKQT